MEIGGDRGRRGTHHNRATVLETREGSTRGPESDMPAHSTPCAGKYGKEKS
jgi:hypothetical protein